jgi:serine/threonine-protein kinase
MDTDRNLLFGVLALQADLIDDAQFARACSEWAGRKQTPLADLLLERGWLTPSDRADVEKLLERKLKTHNGDTRASLAEVATDPVKRTLAGLADADIRESLAGLTTPPEGLVLLSTTAYEPGTRDRYTLSRLHATGGIGRVWLARDASLGRDVALKELRPERAGSPAVWARFLKEAQVTGQLEHPGIVPIYELGHRPEDQQPFYTMRFVRGRTLAQAVAAYHRRRAAGEAGPLDLRELLTAFVGVCNAVGYAHSRGVLHRDLKPQNVVLGDYGEVIVLDWGLARLVGQADGEAAPLELSEEGQAGGTVQGQVLGTPAYMAPEQAEGRLDLLGPVSDVYGLGAILYEILTGRPPFRGDDTTAVLRQVVHVAPARPRSVEKGAPPALEAVCLKALAKKPGERYATAKDLAAEVQRWLADEAVSAYAEPLGARLARRARRHRSLVAGVGAALAVGVVSLALAAAWLAATNRKLQAANAAETEAKQEAEEHEARARENFRLARESVNRYLKRVRDSRRLQDAGLAKLRKELLDEAGDFYRQFIAERANDPTLEAELSQAYLQAAKIESDSGDTTRALQRYEEARAYLQTLATAHPDVLSYQTDLARCQGEMGVLCRHLGRTDDAAAHYGEALRQLEPLAAAHPDDADVLKSLAGVHKVRAGLLRARADYPAAVRSLEKARVLLEQLTAAHPEVGEHAYQLAGSWNNLGLTLRDQRDPEAAITALQKAREVEEKLVARFPDDDGYRAFLGGIHLNLALAYESADRLDEAEAEFVAAVPVYRQVADRHSEVSINLEGLAMSLNETGRFLDDRKKPEQAFAALNEALALWRQLRTREPDVTLYASELTRTLVNLGSLRHGQGRYAEALPYHQEALDLRVKLAAANPDVLLYQTDLQNSYDETGLTLRALGRLPEAEAAFQGAVRVNEGLAAKYPKVARHLSNLADSSHNLGDLLMQAGKPAESLAAHERAVASRQKVADANPTVPRFQRALAGSVRKLGIAQQRGGRPAEAVASFRRAVALIEPLPSPGPDDLYALACYQALLGGAAVEGSGLTAAETRTAADGAMATLRRAVATGYRDVPHMRTDTDLDALRKREDFQKLMKDLEAKPEATGP